MAGGIAINATHRPSGSKEGLVGALDVTGIQLDERSGGEKWSGKRTTIRSSVSCESFSAAASFRPVVHRHDRPKAPDPGTRHHTPGHSRYFEALLFGRRDIKRRLGASR